MTRALKTIVLAALLAAACGSSGDTNPCGPGMAMCGANCVDVENNPNDCGGCGNVCSGTTPFCVSGVCQATCGGGDVYCAGTGCVDVSSNEQHCGACDISCGTAGTCNSGVCLCEPGPGILMCGAECADVATDVDHCGSCFNNCNNDEICTSGVCVCANPAFMNCGGCVDTMVDPDDCGSCGNGCNPEQVCQGSTCVCRPPLEAGAGGCFDPASDPGACGVGGTICGGAMPFCQDGVCVGSCTGGTQNCGGACVDTETHPVFCGACDNPCDADEVCVQGECRNYDIALGGDCATCGGGELCCTYPETTTQICVDAPACP